jgi:hypothetical protein
MLWTGIYVYKACMYGFEDPVMTDEKEISDYIYEEL